LIASDVAGLFFACIKAQAEAAGLLSDEHFTVDGTLIEAWAALKSFRPREEPLGVQVHATFMPDAAQAVSRFPLGLSWSQVSLQF